MTKVNICGELAFLDKSSLNWIPLSDECFQRMNKKTPLDEDAKKQIHLARSRVQEMLASALMLPNLNFLAGSGASLGKVCGPSMNDLWKKCMWIDPDSKQGEDNFGVLHKSAKQVFNKVKYNPEGSPNIEHFLSYCEAFLQFNDDKETLDYVRDVKETIIFECTDFLESDKSDMSAYHGLLQKLARRRVRDPRLKVFTTNYDMCFETAASDLGIMVIDGLSYTGKRKFNGKYFNYDVVRRDQDSHEFVEGIFKLYKLHGSVSWARVQNAIIESKNVEPDNVAMIFPAKGKYQQAFLQPYLELLSRYLESLRESNNCLIISGFGFNDDHLSEPIVSAVTSNPSFKLIIADFNAHEFITNVDKTNPYWAKLFDLASRGYDISFINGTFDDFVSLLPNLKAISPAEQLVNALKQNGLGY
jgi:hypothetical protein